MKKTVIIISLLMVTTASAVSPTLETFNGGQVSPLMESRVTFPKYSSSLRTLENMLVTVQGPVERRPGTKYIAAQKSSSAAGRIIGFDQSADESYILLFEDQVIRFFTDGGQILDGVGTEDISALDNIIAHWLLNEDEGTNVADDDGGTHDGTASVTTSTLNAIGKVGSGCFDLDLQYDVAVPSEGGGVSSDFSFTDNSNDTPFSIACWGLVTQQDDSQVLISKWKDSGSTSEWRFNLTTERKLQLSLADGSAGLLPNTVSQWKLNDDEVGDKVVLDAIALQNGVASSASSSVMATTGKINGAFDFDEQYAVEVNDNAAYSFGDGTDDSPFSIAAWIFFDDSGSSTRDIITKSDATTGSELREWKLYVNSIDVLIFRIYDESANARESIVGHAVRGPLSVGWHFVVATYDGRGGSSARQGMTLYLDNEVYEAPAASSGTYTAMENTATKVVIGAEYDTAGALDEFYEERIDNVTIFDIELSVAQINSLYNEGAGTEEISLPPSPFAITDSAIDAGWHFLCATYSAPADETTAADGIILYVDGVAVDSTATNDADYTAMQDGAEEVRIGSQRNTGDTANEKFWADKIDEISVYGDVLTPTEIASLFSTTPLEITTPYLTADLSSLNVTRNDDIMYISVSGYKPKQLSNELPTLWTLSDVDFQTGPFLPENDTATTIAASATTGSVTLTASTSIFKKAAGASHVGSIWQLNQVGGNPAVTGTFSGNGISLATNNFTGGYSFTTTDTSWVGTITLQRSTNDGISWRPALEPLTDTNFDNPGETEEDGAMYRIVASDYTSGSLDYKLTIHDETNRGVVRITGVESGTVATATVLNDIVSTSATTLWREGYWSDFRGWPRTVTVHQQRLVYGGSVSFPQTVWWGRQDPDEYENFLEGTLDTSAFTVELEGQNPIRWLLSQDYMLIGTSGTIGKWGAQGEAVTPTSPNYQEQTRHGSAAIQAGLGGDSVLYIERGNRKVRQFSFDLQVDKYLSPDLTILSPEITDGGIDEIAFQLRPDPILWCVLADGDIATLTYQRDQSIAAWAKQTTDGDFESIAVISGQAGTSEDEIWVIAKREIDTNDDQVEETFYYVEQFQPQDWGSDDNDAWFVDSGITYDGVATDTFTGAGHLEAETVSIYADRLIESPEIVVSGGFTIDNAAARVLVGMPYTSKLETLPLVIDPQDRAKDKKVKSLWFDLYKTGAFQYGNGANSELTNFNFANNLDLDNTATAKDLDADPATSITKPVLCRWVYGSMKKQTIYVESDEPMPLTIRSITASYNFYGD